MMFEPLLSGLQPSERRALIDALLAYNQSPNEATEATLYALAPSGDTELVLRMADALSAVPGSNWVARLQNAHDRPTQEWEDSAVRLSRILASADNARRRTLVSHLLESPTADTDAMFRAWVGGDDAEWLIDFRHALQRSPSSPWVRHIRAKCTSVPDSNHHMFARESVSAAGSDRLRRTSMRPSRFLSRVKPRIAIPSLAATLAVVGALVGLGLAPGEHTHSKAPVAWNVVGPIDQPAWIGQPTGVSEYESAAITCPGADVCFATDPLTGARGASVIESTSDGGASWLPITLPDNLDLVASLSCPAVQSCVGIAKRTTSRAPVAVVTTDGGSSWATHPMPDTGSSAFGLTCPTVDDCVAVGSGPATVNASLGGANPSVAVTTDGGASWTAVPLPQAFVPATPAGAVSCTTRSTCVVAGASSVGSPGGPTTLDADVQYTVDGGWQWRPSQLPSGIGRVRAVSCSYPSSCLATAERHPAAPNTATVLSKSVALVTHNDGRTWSYASRAGFDLDRATTVTCATSTKCWVAGLRPDTPLDNQSAGFLVTQDGGRSWSQVSLPAAMGTLRFISSISCFRPTTCTGLAWSATSTSQVTLRDSPGSS
jgi:photosystem II stability/assembly factor-like uncharacterized protein